MALCLASCRPDKPATSAPQRWDLSSPPLLDHWQDARMEHSGGVQRGPDGYSLKAGAPMTGIVFPTWVQDGLPLTDYRLTYEAMRVSGSDFFASVTFPVGSLDRCVTFVLGGWGGSQVGISSIDGQDASMNATGSSQRFEDGKWYRIRIEVTKNSLAVWLDDKPLVRIDITNAQLGLRTGEIDKCAPFGFASYGAEGRIRACVIDRLPPSP